MAKPLAIAEKPQTRRAGEHRGPSYRAVTLAAGSDEWAVMDDRGSVVYRGDARVAAMIASRLTLPSIRLLDYVAR